MFFVNDLSFNNALNTVGTPHIQIAFLHLFIILLTILEENLGISTTPKELASGACMVIHRPNPWKLGRTDIKDLPINWSGVIHIISLILLAVKLKLRELRQMVLLSPVVEAL